MAMTTGSSAGVQSDINVTPMIDVLLVLLIIFMITQPLSRMALDVQVPPPDTPQTTKAPPSQIVLELADGGGYSINGQPVPRDQLDTQIHAIYDQRPAKLLFIKAGPNRIYQDVIQAMDVARGAGVLITLSSWAAQRGSGNPHLIAYAASKAGIIGLTKAAALEYASQGIRVNSVCPAFVATAMVEKFLQETDMTEQIKRFHPIGRLGTESEIAQAVLFLASSDASFMTGAALSVDGGMAAA